MYKKIIAICSQIRTKHANILCGLKVEILNAVHAVTTGPQTVKYQVYRGCILKRMRWAPLQLQRNFPGSSASLEALTDVRFLQGTAHAVSEPCKFLLPPPFPLTSSVADLNLETREVPIESQFVMCELVFLARQHRTSDNYSHILNRKVEPHYFRVIDP